MGSPPGHQPADLEVLMPAHADLPPVAVADLVVDPLAVHRLNLRRVCLYWYLVFQLSVFQLWGSPLSDGASPGHLLAEAAAHRDRPWLPSAQYCRSLYHRCVPCVGHDMLDRWLTLFP